MKVEGAKANNKIIPISEKYPQIKKLFGVDPMFKFKVLALVLLQFCMLLFMRDKSWPVVILTAYFFGGVINHALMLAVHEIAHSAGFGVERPLLNRCLGIFANLPIGIPFAVAFKGYHLEHHKYQGQDVIDADIPTVLEARLFCTTLGKFVWVCLQPLFYALRPLFTNPKKPLKLELVNTIVQVSFDLLVVHFLGKPEEIHPQLCLDFKMFCHQAGKCSST